MRRSLCVLLALSIFIGGCAADASRMVPAQFNLANHHPYTVSVDQAIGGKETNPLWTSQISSKDFTAALTESLKTSGVFESVVEGSDADYLLTFTILDYSQPLFGLNFDITTKSK